jgi:hypothetical protein
VASTKCHTRCQANGVNRLVAEHDSNFHVHGTVLAIFKLYQFLVTFAKFRKVTIGFVMTVCPSVRPSEWNNSIRILIEFDTSIFRKSAEKIQVSLKSDKERVFYMKTDIHFWLYLSHFFLEWKTFHTKFVKKSRHILCWIIVFQKSCRLWDNVRKYYRVGRATDDNMAHAHFIQDTQRYKYIFGICNSYCFFIAIMIALTCVSVTLYLHCMSFWQK